MSDIPAPRRQFTPNPVQATPVTNFAPATIQNSINNRQESIRDFFQRTNPMTVMDRLDTQSIQTIMAQYTGDAMEGMAKLYSSAYIADRLGMDIGTVWNNYESVTEQYLPEPRDPMSNWDSLKNSWQTGWQQYQINNLYFQLRNNPDDYELQQQIQEAEGSINLADNRNRGWLVNNLKTAFEMAPNTISAMRNGLQRGLEGAAGGMAAGLVAGATAGSVVPGAGTLVGGGVGAVSMALGGFAVGWTYGTFEESKNIAAGVEYRNLIGRGIDHDTAYYASGVMGAMIGAIELINPVDFIPAGGQFVRAAAVDIAEEATRRATKRSVAEAASDAVRNAVARVIGSDIAANIIVGLGGSIATETAEEFLQEIVSVVGTNATIYANNNFTDREELEYINSEQFKEQLKEVVLTTAQASIFLSAPGALISGGGRGAVNSLFEQRRRQQIASQFPNVDAELVEQMITGSKTWEEIDYQEALVDGEWVPLSEAPDNFNGQTRSTHSMINRQSGEVRPRSDVDRGDSYFVASRSEDGVQTLYPNTGQAAAKAEMESVRMTRSQALKRINENMPGWFSKMVNEALEGKDLTKYGARLAEMNASISTTQALISGLQKMEAGGTFSNQEVAALSAVGIEVQAPNFFEVKVAGEIQPVASIEEFNNSDMKLGVLPDGTVLSKDPGAIVPVGVVETKRNTLPRTKGVVKTTQENGTFQAIDPETSRPVATLKYAENEGQTILTNLPANPVIAAELTREFMAANPDTVVTVDADPEVMQEVLESNPVKQQVRRRLAAFYNQLMRLKDLAEQAQEQQDIETLEKVNQQIQELMPQIAELENSLDQIDAEFMGITESDVQISTEEVAQKIAEKLSTERIQRAELEAKVQEIFEGKYTNDEIQAMLALADLRAEALGMTTDQWVEQNLVLPVSLEMNDGVNTQYKGVTSFIEDGQRAIIAMNEKADVSTWIHEFTHATRRQLSDEQNNTLLEWTGESEWNTRAEEIVAVGMEEYMYTGRFNVPKAIQTIFKQLKKMIGKVYNSIKWLRKQNQDQPALTDAVARVFDEMFTPGSIRNPDVNGNVNSRSVTPAEQDQTDMPLFQTKDHRHPTTMFQRLVIDMDKVLEWKEIADFETVEDRALHNAKAEVMEALWGEEALTEDITYELQKITPEKVGDAEYTNQMLEYIGDRRFFEEIYEEQLDWANDDAELVTNFDPGTDLWEWAKSVKGTTDDINEAGYILPDGTLLDFSGKRDGGPMGDRAEDHRQLGLPTEEYITGTDLMLAFMEDGAIRIDANSGLVDIARRPTFDQEAKIREVLEMNPDNGYVEMDDGERQYAFAVNNPRAAIGRIRRWFNGEDFEEDILFQIVYHGTPHTFDRFSLDYMGTGEGAQVFGWGLYFTDQESIGRHYAKVLARKKIENLYNFKPISDALIAEGVLNDRQIEIAMRAVRVNMKTAWADPMPFLERELSRHRYEFMKAQQMIDAARAELATPEKYRSKYARDIDKSIMLFKNSKNRAESNFSQYWGLKKAIELLKQDDQKVLEQKIIQPARNLYKVSLPENAQWIQWNKEYTVEEAEALFSRFPEVKEFIALKDQILVDAIFDENTGDQGEVVARMNELRETEAVKVFEKWGTYSHLTGERLVKSLEDMKNPRAASLWLKRNFGVLGTKFPASSMGRGDGSKGWNYVVFDDAAVAIEEHIMFQQDLKPIPESEGGNLPPATWDYLFENGYKPENASDTQITTTVPTYMAIAEDQEKSAVILDYSAGLGHGTKAMREAGYTVDGYEPFTNPEKRAVDPEFTREDASDIPSERYDVVINNAVLNVVPMATRVDIVKNIYRALKPGGSAYIQARNWGGIKPTLKNPKTKLVGPREVITGKGTFQKGFTQPELTAFIQEILPEAIVERGKHGDIKVKVTKPEILFQRDQSIDPTEGDQRISVRKGTEKTDKVPAREATILGLESILSRPGLAKKYAAIFEGDPNAKRPKKITDDNFIVLTEGYAGFKRPEGMSDEEYLTRIVNQMADNLMFLYNLESPEFRERSRKWYDAAYAISKEWGRQYGVPHQAVAGAIAALSSQKDWNQNVSIAKRIMDGLMNLGDERMDDQVRAHAEKWLEDSKGSKSYNTNVSIYESIGDKTLNELEDPDAAGMFIRFWDEVYNQNNFRVIEPDGTFSGYKITGKGARAKIQYGSFSELGKAVSIFRDPSPENISAVISAAPKVRSFYNNILMPWSDRGEITVDTHAVAGALLQPLGGSAIEVDVALSDKGSAAEGVRGTNPIFAEAYRIAADRAGVLPREMQSITWVAAQQGFDGKKDDKRRREAYNIWKGVEGFNQEQAEDAREQIRILFDLASTDEGTYIATDAYDGDEVYPGELSDRERSRAGRGATDGIVESGDLGRSAERSGNTRARGLRKDLLFQGDQEEVNPERDARREELQAALENSEHVPLENLQEFSDEEWADAAIFEITFNGMDSVQYEPAPGDYDKVVEGGDDGFPPNDSNAQHDYELLMDQDLWGDYQLNDYINDTKQFDPKRLPSRESANQAVLDSYANPEGMEALRTAVRSARARHEALDGIGFGGKQFTYFSARQPNQAQLDAAIREAEANPNGFREATHKILALNKSEEDQVASLIDDLINKYEPLATDDPEASRRVAREEDDRRRKAAVADLFDDIQQKIKVIRGDIKKDEVKKAFSDVRKDLKEVQARYAKSVNRADALERDLYETNRAASRLQDKVKKDKKLTDSEIKALKKRVATLDERSKKYKAKATKERQNVRQAVKEMKMIYRSLNRAKKLVEYQQNLIGQIKRLSQRKNVDFAYKEMVRHLLDGLSFEIMGPRKREQFNKERQIFKEYREANPDMNISEEWMNRYYQTYLQDYTIDDLELLKARVKEIIDAGATVMKVKKAARARRIQSNVIRLQDSLLEQLRRTNSGLTTDELREQVTTRTRLDDERNRLKGAFYGTITPQYLFDRLDGGRDFSGPFMDIFYNVAQDVTEDRQRMVQSRTDAAQAKIEELGITDEELLEPFYDMGGQDLNIQETIGLYTKMQNEKAANAIMYGNKFPLEQVYKAIEQLPSKFKDLGDWIIEHGYGDHYYRLREAFIENENAEMGMEERYTPIQRKSIIGTELDQQIKDDLLGSMALAPAKTQDGFTKSRVSIPADWQTPIRLDEWTMLLEMIDKQEHYIHATQAVKDMAAVLKDRTLQQLIAEVHDPEAVKTVDRWIQRFAAPSRFKTFTPIDQMFKGIRRNAAMAYLAFNMMTPFKQLPSYLYFIAETDVPTMVNVAGNMANGARRREFEQRMYAYSPQLKDRNIERYLNDFKTKNAKGWEKIQQMIGKPGMWAIRQMDRLAVTAGWNAVFDYQLANGKTDVEAARIATNTTMRTQPVGDAKDISDLFAQPGAISMFTQFGSQLNQIWSATTHLGPAMQAQTLNKWLASMTSIIIGGFMMTMMKWKRPPEDEEEWTMFTLEAVLGQFINSVPIAGSIFMNALAGFDSDLPISAPITATANVGREVVQVIQGDKDFDAGSIAKKAWEGVSIYGGIPYIQPKRIIDGIADTYGGDPKTDGDWINMIITMLFGRPKRRRN